MRMVYTGAKGQALLTSHAWGRLFEIQGPLVFGSFILSSSATCLHTAEEMAKYGFEDCISGRGRAPEKVTATDLFYLRRINQGTVNILYLLA
ncbi:hypothetical protein Tco_0682575 [Tanacetum coccineum]|uniref:Uncharacterized protein n=1 Tax=Tanacetum coccineum TaxID=301880 RepID=A0ABQ4XRL2_9ASTR